MLVDRVNGPMYVSKDGPVFTAEQVARLPQDDL